MIKFLKKLVVIIAIFIALFILLIITGIIYIALNSEQGQNTLIQAEGYTLNAKIYGKSPENKTVPAINFFSGWNPEGGITTSDIHAGLIAKKLKCICVTVSLRGMGSSGDINTLTRNDFLNDVIAVYDYVSNLKGVDT